MCARRFCGCVCLVFLVCVGVCVVNLVCFVFICDVVSWVGHVYVCVLFYLHVYVYCFCYPTLCIVMLFPHPTLFICCFCHENGSMHVCHCVCLFLSGGVFVLMCCCQCVVLEAVFSHCVVLCFVLHSLDTLT